MTYEKESELIKKNKEKPENKKSHKFKAAEWTHPNAHPRCIRCGEEESVSGICHPEVSEITGAYISDYWILPNKQVKKTADHSAFVKKNPGNFGLTKTKITKWKVPYIGAGIAGGGIRVSLYSRSVNLEGRKKDISKHIDVIANLVASSKPHEFHVDFCNDRGRRVSHWSGDTGEFFKILETREIETNFKVKIIRAIVKEVTMTGDIEGYNVPLGWKFQLKKKKKWRYRPYPGAEERKKKLLGIGINKNLQRIK